jgi:hypothetical protein
VVAEIGGTEVAEQRPASMGSDAVMASAAAAKTGTGSRAAHSFGLSNGRVAELDACRGRIGPVASTAHSPNPGRAVAAPARRDGYGRSWSNADSPARPERRTAPFL